MKAAPFYSGLKCQVCGSIFAGWTKGQETCSRSCQRVLYHARRRAKLGTPRKCAHCGSEWIAMPKDGHKFCSWECHAADKGHKGLRTAQCEECGNAFQTYRHNPDVNGHGRFCSRDCFREFSKRRVTRTCECCGAEFEVLESQFRSQPTRFCTKDCEREFLRGDRHPAWKGADYEFVSSKGWVMARKNGQGKHYPKHRIIASSAIGRWLNPWEIVIHIDGNKLNNSPANLYLFHSRSDWVKVQMGDMPWPLKSNLHRSAK